MLAAKGRKTGVRGATTMEREDYSGDVGGEFLSSILYDVVLAGDCIGQLRVYVDII